MNITKEFKDWFDKFQDCVFDLGACFEEGEVSLVPMVISGSTINTWEKDLTRLLRLARIVSKSTYNKEAYEVLPYSKMVEQYLDQEHMPVIARPDAILVGEQLKLVELNVDSTLGGIFELDFLAQSIRENPLISAKNLLVESPKKGFVEFINGLFDDVESEHRNIVFFTCSQYEISGRDVVEEFADWISEETDISAVMCFAENLWVEDGYVTDGSMLFPVAYRFGIFMDKAYDVKPMENLMVKAGSSKTRMISDPKDLLIEHKLIIVQMRDYALDETSNCRSDDRELILRYLPWTVMTSIPTVEYNGAQVSLETLLKENKDQFVLKKCDSYAGKHVIIGSESDSIVWNNLVDTVINNKNEIWVAQESLESTHSEFIYYDHKNENLYSKKQRYVISPYIFGKKLSSCLIRVEKDPDSRVLSVPSARNMSSAILATDSV